MKNQAALVAFSIWIISVLLFWGLAFFPSNAFQAEWLEQARSACFGMLDDRLPDAAGFMLLTLAPLMFLAAILIAWPGELKNQIRYFSRSKLGKGIAAFVLILFAIEATWAFNGISNGLKITRFDYRNPATGGLPPNYPKTEIKASEFNLVNQLGNRVSIAESKGKTVVLTFAFAHCQTVCPTIVKQSVEAIKEVGANSVDLLIITLDPWRDTPKSLPGLAKKWDLPENAHILSGSVEEVNEAIKSYNMQTTRNEQNGDIVHPALTYILDESGYIRYTFNNAPASWITEGIKNMRLVTKN